MTWTALAPVIARYGLEFGIKLWEMSQRGGLPTAADFEELRALARQDARSQLENALRRNGVPLDSARAKELLALVEA